MLYHQDKFIKNFILIRNLFKYLFKIQTENNTVFNPNTLTFTFCIQWCFQHVSVSFFAIQGS